MRIKIALRNLYISQALILFFLFYAYLTWYPYSFSQLGGFKKTAATLLLVDLVLGPLLVFIIFKEGKKYLKFDINVLLLIQIIAFIYGAYALFLQHPAYVVFHKNQFKLINVSHLYPSQPWFKQLKTSFFSSPKLVITQFPNNTTEQLQLALDIDINGKPDIERRPELFKPIENHLNDILTRSISLDVLSLSTDIKQIQALINKNGGTINDYAFFPLSGNNKRQFIWALNRNTGKPVGIIDFNSQFTKSLAQTQSD